MNINANSSNVIRLKNLDKNEYKVLILGFNGGSNTLINFSIISFAIELDTDNYLIPFSYKIVDNNEEIYDVNMFYTQYITHKKLYSNYEIKSIALCDGIIYIKKSISPLTLSTSIMQTIQLKLS
jgi:hypothetical protein